MINTRMRAKVAWSATLIGASMLVASAATAEPVEPVFDKPGVR